MATKPNFSLRWKLWLGAEVAIPLLFIFLAYPIRLCCSVHDAFTKTMANGDMLLAAAILLCSLLADVYYELSSVAETSHGPKLKNLRSGLDTHMVLGALFCLVAFLACTAIKAAEIVSARWNLQMAREEVFAEITFFGGLALLCYGVLVHLKLTSLFRKL